MEEWESVDQLKSSNNTCKQDSENDTENNLPLLTFNNLTDKGAHRRTGFCDIATMLAFIILVCNGNHDTMIFTVSSLTWLEEWVLYFEFIWGRTITRWIDAGKVTGRDRKKAMEIYHHKQKQILACHMSWPKYCCHKEDCKMRKEK